jgi:hypothetical protein
MALTPDEALLQIQRAGATGRFEIERFHALPQMRARGVSREDVKFGLQMAVTCQLQANGRWKVHTLDLSQESLVVIVAIQDGVLVITVF